MPIDVVSGVPPWVLIGTALGGAASVLVALVFYVGNRLSPPRPRSADEYTRSGDARRHGEIREYLSAIDERVYENHALGGIVVPFYLPERGVAVTFDAHDYFRLQSEGVYAVLCEHEMPGRALGRRLPFEVTEPDRGPNRPPRAGPSRDPTVAAFEELGLGTGADVEEVRRAYRERVKDVHPDRGGDRESFRRVRESYATARAHAEGSADRGAYTNRAGRAERTDRAGRAERTDRTGRAPGFGR